MQLKPIIISLCDFTHDWPCFYAQDDRFIVKYYDLIRDSKDIRLLQLQEMREGGYVYGVLSAPPCTRFSLAGAHTWKNATDEQMIEALSVVDATLRIVWALRPTFWAMENPKGQLTKWLGQPQFKFQPNEYGDPYTKETWLWGNFNKPLDYDDWVPASEGSKMHHKVRDPQERAITPLGFARAFYLANS